MKRLQRILMILTGIFWLGFICCTLPVYAQEPFIIVIDPGHGGENLGAQYEGYTEKEMTMVVAMAMKEELEKYENVVVYLTHETDTDMSIKDRAAFAGEKNADFLFCLHFNSSVNHNLYGAEVWVPAFGDYYVKGRQFAEIEMELLSGLGLYSRGIKTRLNDKGDNYYGILRYCSKEGVPSALIEHCHLDQKNDKPFYQESEEQLKDFGRLDAEAAAKYLGLRSIKKGTDYSDYPKPAVAAPSGAVKPDKTPPEECSIEVLSIDESTGEAMVKMNARDADSYILYYNYSLNGGNTYSDLESWPRPVWDQSDTELTFTVQLPFEQEIELRTNAYNGFDVWTESNIVTIPAISKPAEESSFAEEEKAHYEELTYQPLEQDKEQKQEEVFLILLIFFISLIMAALIFAVINMLFRLKRNNKRRKRQ